MAEFVTKIRTLDGDKKIDYNALANLPTFDETLTATEYGYIADAKATKDAINAVSSGIESFKSEVNTKLDNFFTQEENEDGTVISTVHSLLSMDGKKITNLGMDEQPADTDAATVKYVNDAKASITEYLDGVFKQETQETSTEGEEGESGEEGKEGEETASVVTIMQTPISMNENKITGLAAPEEDTDAATKKYVDDVVGDLFQKEKNEDGESVTIMQTIIQMNENKITGLGEPVEDTDAATKKYVDERRIYTTATLYKDQWSGDTAPFTYEVEWEGILESDTPHWGIMYSDALETKLLEKTAFALVDDLDTSENKFTFTCFKNKPGIDLYIQIEVNR